MEEWVNVGGKTAISGMDEKEKVPIFSDRKQRG